MIVRTALAYIGLGSNLNDPVAQVRAGIEALAALEGCELERVSSYYRSAPVGFAGQPDFINAACRLRTSLSARSLMHELLEIEHARGRLRVGTRGGPRVLDLDLLLYADLEVREPGLVLPHPRLHERAFVLYPLAELDPALTVPGHGKVIGLLARCSGQRIEKLGYNLENYKLSGE